MEMITTDKGDGALFHSIINQIKPERTEGYPDGKFCAICQSYYRIDVWKEHFHRSKHHRALRRLRSQTTSKKVKTKRNRLPAPEADSDEKMTLSYGGQTIEVSDERMKWAFVEAQSLLNKAFPAAGKGKAQAGEESNKQQRQLNELD